MKNLKIVAIIPLLFLMIYTSCKKDDTIDKQKPEIILSIPDAFPVNCDTFYFGDTVRIKVLFSDNAELGSKKAFSLDIHHNFDHHSHSTEVTECILAPVKDPVNPFTLIGSYDIPEGIREYETNLSVTIPSGNGIGSFDEGDYHFFISLTDKEGWSAQKGLSIKILKH